MTDSLSPELVHRMHAYWRAANYLSVGQIYLQDNPLLELPLSIEHVIMGTRSGDLDPGVLVYLMRKKKFDADRIEEFVDHQSGLIGISGVGRDKRHLHEAAATNADARLAIEMFCYAVRKQVAGMIAALDGVDMIVFTGGIGENDALARGAICAGLSWIGVSLDESRNRSASNPIHDAGSRCAVHVLASREDEQIARHTWALVPRKEPSQPS